MDITILVVEDESSVAEIIAAYLMRQNYSVICVTTLAEARRELTKPIDLVVLDLMLPDGKGETLCKEIRQHGNIPVIMLTAKNSEQSKIGGFACGADDYLTKPFSPKELVARVGAILRRSGHDGSDINIGSGVIINFKRHEVSKNGQPIALTPSEFTILEHLVKYKNTVITRAQFMDIIESDGEVFDRTIDAHVKNLRAKIEDNPKQPQLISTVYGLGYRYSEVK